MPINSHHRDFDNWVQIWEKINDCVSGEDAIKKKSERYLPRLPGQELKTDTGYQSYLSRAVFENFTGRTLDISLGQIFRKKPVITGVDQAFLDNIDLSGQNFDYFSRDVAKDILLYNRVGILVDYSVEQGRPFLTEFDYGSIINWKTIVINGIEKLQFVILEGEKEIINKDDPYTEKKEKIWKELYLDLVSDENNLPYAGFYKVRDWVKNPSSTDTKNLYIIVEGSEITPIMDNTPLDFIPLFFLSNSGFNWEIEESTLLDMANVNLAHYRNSADYENLLHLTGAGTYILKGWDDSKAFPVGGAANFPVDGGAEILQGRSDSGLETAMRHKEEIMAMIGSQILSGKGRYVASAQTAQTQSSGEYATLADISNSLSYCMTIIMKLFVEWSGGNSADVNVSFNTDFEVGEIPQGKLTEFMGAVQSGQMSRKTFFYNLQNYELYPASWTEEDEKSAIEEDQLKMVAARDQAINQNVGKLMEPVKNQMDMPPMDTMPKK